MANTIIRSLIAGELAPALYARADLATYQSGLRTCRNFIVLRSGGVANRPGTAFVSKVKSPLQPVRLIKFIFNSEQTYILEFGPFYMRVYQNGGTVVSSGVIPYEIATPYAAAHLMQLQVVQTADVMTIVHGDYAPRELARFGHTDWRLSVIVFGPRVGTPGSLVTSGGAAGTTRTWLVTAVDATTLEEGNTGAISAINRVPAAGTPTIVEWAAVPNALYYNVYRGMDSSAVGFVGVGGGSTIDVVDTTWLPTTSTVSGTFATAGSKVATDAAVNQIVTPGIAKAFDGQYTIIGSAQVTITPGDFTTNWSVLADVAIFYSRDSELRVFAGRFPAGSHRGAGSTTGPWTVAIVVPDNGYTNLTIEAVAEYTFTEASPPSTCSTTATITGTKIEWLRTGTAFSDVGNVADFGHSPPTFPNLFDAPRRYPQAVGFYQQRRLFGNSYSEPDKVWGSRIGVFQNYSRSFPIQDDDAVTFSLIGRQVNEVRHLLDLSRLLAFTSGAELVIEGDQAGIVRPGEVNPRQYTYTGAAKSPPPLTVVDTALYVQARGTIVRDLLPTKRDEGTNTDLSVFASHLFDGYTIVDWDYAQIPGSVVWVVRSDGVLLGLTYLREQGVWAWHRHDTDGLVERVCVVPEGTEDRVYLVVQRTTAAGVQRFVERMATRRVPTIADAVFMDASLLYNGRNTTSNTMTLTGGIIWSSDEWLTLVSSAVTFTADDIGNMIIFHIGDGDLRCEILAILTPTSITVRPHRSVPSDVQGTPQTTWSIAVDVVAGLGHLEGKNVSVLADGVVVANPLNTAYPIVTVVGGQIQLERPFGYIRIGLPYASDLETLDLESTSSSSIKDKRMLVSRLMVFVESSRGIFAGQRRPVGLDPLDGLTEYKTRSHDTTLPLPPALVTDTLEMGIDASWSDNGRVFIRQVDPLPLSILAITPQGYFPSR